MIFLSSWVEPDEEGEDETGDEGSSDGEEEGNEADMLSTYETEWITQKVDNVFLLYYLMCISFTAPKRKPGRPQKKRTEPSRPKNRVGRPRKYLMFGETHIHNVSPEFFM